MKYTATAPSNIAFIKYWGRKDEKLRLPSNGSLSMNLSGLHTTTTVEFNPNLDRDMILIDGQKNDLREKRVTLHLDYIRSISGVKSFARVESKNNFPSATGLSSSASAFAALTVAAVKASGITVSQKEMTQITRLASGSSCRSIPDGFVIWHEGNSSETSFAETLFSENHWNLIDIVVIFSENKKRISTTQAQFCANQNPFFETRLKRIDKKINNCTSYLKNKNFAAFGELIENEALELHAIMFTQSPSLVYLYPQTVGMIHDVRQWRLENIPVYFSLNTGHNMHLICEEKSVAAICKKLDEKNEILRYIINSASKGTVLTDTHLF